MGLASEHVAGTKASGAFGWRRLRAAEATDFAKKLNEETEEERKPPASGVQPKSGKTVTGHVEGMGMMAAISGRL